MRQIGDECRGRRKRFKVLSEDLASAAPAFSVLQCMEQGLDDIVGPIDNANTAAGF